MAFLFDLPLKTPSLCPPLLSTIFLLVRRCQDALKRVQARQSSSYQFSVFVAHKYLLIFSRFVELCTLVQS